VNQQLAPGYLHRDHVLRPALVVVVRRPPTDDKPLGGAV
jgi:hypothetical protein